MAIGGAIPQLGMTTSPWLAYAIGALVWAAVLTLLGWLIGLLGRLVFVIGWILGSVRWRSTRSRVGAWTGRWHAGQSLRRRADSRSCMGAFGAKSQLAPPTVDCVQSPPEAYPSQQ